MRSASTNFGVPPISSKHSANRRTVVAAFWSRATRIRPDRLIGGQHFPL